MSELRSTKRGLIPPVLQHHAKRRALLGIVGGAIGLSVASRVLGLLRELLIVGRIGVHDYTDAYFATSTIVLWLQNWSFGAWTLYFVPKFLSLRSEDRGRWVRQRLRSALLFGAIGAFVFVVGYPFIEGFLLGGRHVLGRWPAFELALALPATAAGGVLYARLIAIRMGILLAARALFIANLGGLLSLVLLLVGFVPAAHVLPLTLMATQIGIAVAMALANRKVQDDEDGRQAGESAIDSSQAFAATFENVGFNSNSIAHQAIAGRLPEGGLTLNAYATRLLLLPVTGLMAPVQQRLMQHFATHPAKEGLAVARRVIAIAVALGLVVGVLTMGGLLVVAPFLPARLSGPLHAYHVPAVALGYGCYAGILFSNGVTARWYFASGAGWSYAFFMLAGYVVGTAAKAGFLAPLGMTALPLGAIVGEGLALLSLLVVGHRKQGPADTLTSPTNS